MTVAELIECLRKYPSEMRVVVAQRADNDSTYGGDPMIQESHIILESDVPASEGALTPIKGWGGRTEPVVEITS